MVDEPRGTGGPVALLSAPDDSWWGAAIEGGVKEVDNRPTMPKPLYEESGPHWTILNKTKGFNEDDAEFYRTFIRPEDKPLANYKRNMGKVFGIARVDGKTFYDADDTAFGALRRRYHYADKPRRQTHHLIFMEVWLLKVPIAMTFHTAAFRACSAGEEDLKKQLLSSEFVYLDQMHRVSMVHSPSV